MIKIGGHIKTLLTAFLVLSLSFLVLTGIGYADLEPPFVLQLSHDTIEWTPDSTVSLTATVSDFQTTPGAEKGTDIIEVTDRASLSWKTSIGRLASSHSKATLHTPSIGGTGEVTVTASFEGEQISKSIPVKVCINARPTPDTPCDTSPVAPKSSAPAQTSIIRETPGASTSLPPTTADRTTLSAFDECIRASLGGRTESTPADEPKIRACYEQTGKPLPAIAETSMPVKPNERLVNRLATTNELRVNQLENQLRRSPYVGETMIILLSGTAFPGKTVFIYILSESQVTAITANQDGTWSYELKNPLTPGRHMAYAVAEQAPGQFVRSEGVPFGIGQAENDRDAQGRSLTIVPLESLPKNYLPYLVGLGFAVIVIGVVILIRRTKRP